MTVNPGVRQIPSLMKIQSMPWRGVFAACLCSLSTLTFALAEDPNPPVVVHPISDVLVSAGSAPTKIDLKNTFGLNGVTGKVVRMTTNLGNIDVELLGDIAPNTVANFLNYVDSGSYDNVIFHRVTSLAADGLAVVQGGETTLVGNTISLITTFGNVVNEYSLPNTRGTIAMAKIGGNPDSASDQWFFNVSDNTDALGSSNDGGFTVFGRVIGRGLETVDAIAALKPENLVSVRSSWSSIPLYNFDESQSVGPGNLVVASSVAVLPMISKGKGFPGLLTLKVKSNGNPDLVAATLKGRKLLLTYQPGKTGTAAITLQARGGGSSKFKYTFQVTVE